MATSTHNKYVSIPDWFSSSSSTPITSTEKPANITNVYYGGGGGGGTTDTTEIPIDNKTIVWLDLVITVPIDNDKIIINTEGKITTSGTTGVWELRQLTDGTNYIYTTYPVVTLLGITMYAGTDGLDLGSIYDGLPIDNATIYWDLDENGNKILKAIGSSGGVADSVAWANVTGKPDWLLDGKIQYTEIEGTPDLSGFITKDYIDGKFVTFDLDETIDGIKTFTNGIKIGTSLINQSLNDVIYIDANLAVRGGITMYATGTVDIPSILDSLPVAGTDSKGIASFDSSYFSVTNGKVTLLADNVGLNESELAEYLNNNNYAKKSDIPSLSNYATQSWVESKGYALNSDLMLLTTKVDDFLEGSDTDTIINKWLELEAFLSGLSESDNLATILSTKADKNYVDDTFVTLATPQTIVAEKNFTGGLKVNGSPIVYDTEKKYWKLEGDLLVTGGVTMYANEGTYTPSTIMDALLYDDTTLGINSEGKLYVKGGSGGGLDITALQNYLTQNSYLNVTEGDGRYLKLSGGTITTQLEIESGYENKLILNNNGAATYKQYIDFRQSNTTYGLLGTNGGTDLLWNEQKVLHAGNYSQYALPLSGGTLTGALNLPIDTYNYIGSSIALWVKSDTPNALRLYTPSGLPSIAFFNNDGWKGTLGVNENSDLLWTSNKVWHEGNFTPSNYLPLSGGTLTGGIFFGDGSTGANTKASNTRFPSHIYRNVFDAAGNVYDHYYNSEYTNSTYTYANLRVKNGTSYQVLRFGGDGSFTWAGNRVWHEGVFNPSNYLPLSGGTMTGNILLGGTTTNKIGTNIVDTTGGYQEFTHQNSYGYIAIGPFNSSVAHIYTDRGSFYFNKELLVVNNKVWHAGNFNPSNYLPLTGGTLNSGTIAPLSLQSPSSSGQIILRFYRGTNYWGALGFDGENSPIFKNATGTNYSIWHSGNDGDGSGLDADLLDGQQGSYYTPLFNNSPTLLTNSHNLNNYTKGYYGYEDAINPSNSFGNNTAVLALQSVRGCDTWQIVFDGNNINYTSGPIIGIRGNFANQGWTTWFTLATTSSNVASATKLQTARTIWGQSFDGTGNITGQLNITTGTNIALTYGTGLLTIGTMASAHIAIDTNDIQAKADGTTASTLYLNDYGGNVSMCGNSGNVGIGTANPQYRLDIVGNTRLTGGWYRSKGAYGWYSEDYAGGWYMTDATWIRNYNSKPLLLEIGTNNTNGIGGHRVGLTLRGASHCSIMMIGTNGGAGYGWGIAANADGNFYVGRRTGESAGYSSSTDSYKFRLDGSGNGLFYGGVTMYSDQRKKTILRNVELSLKEIVNAPLVEHYYNSDNKKTTHVGSIAQYWAGLNDWFCKLDNEGYYTMEIQNAALASAISVARELDRYETKTDKAIKKLKKRICELEEEVERLKAN